MVSQRRPATRTSKMLVLMMLAAGFGLLSRTPCATLRAPPARGMVRVYYYTSQKGYDRILTSQRISPSKFIHGGNYESTAVMTTELDPSQPFWTILENFGIDFGDRAEKGEDENEMADFVFAFDVKEDSVKRLNAGNRSIVLIGNGHPVQVSTAIFHGRAAEAQIAMHCVRVHHYTDLPGYEGIKASGQINPSEIRQGDACYGKYVYVTELPPKTKSYVILKNNYDMDGGIQGRGEDKKNRSKYVIIFDVEESKVKFIDTEGKRSVLGIGGGGVVELKDAIFHGPREEIAGAAPKKAPPPVAPERPCRPSHLSHKDPVAPPPPAPSPRNWLSDFFCLLRDAPFWLFKRLKLLMDLFVIWLKQTILWTAAVATLILLSAPTKGILMIIVQELWKAQTFHRFH